MTEKKVVSSWKQFVNIVPNATEVLSNKFVQAMEALDNNNIQISAAKIENNRVLGAVPFVWLECQTAQENNPVVLRITERHSSIQIVAFTNQRMPINNFFDEGWNYIWHNKMFSCIDVTYENAVPTVKKCIETAKQKAVIVFSDFL